MSHIGMTYSSWLHRPYLDLGSMPDGAPSHTVALDVDRRCLVEGRHYPYFAQTNSPSFRDELILVSGLAEYDVDSPLQLDPDLRTPDWQLLCEHLDTFAQLAADVRVRVVRLLLRLGFFHYVRNLVPANIDAHLGRDDNVAGLAFLRALAGCRLWSEGLEPSYRPAEFERIATSAPEGLWKIAATYFMVRSSVKDHADLAATRHWQALHEKAVHEVRDDLAHQDYLMAVSRLHRAGAFIPQMQRDAEETVRQMDLAEDYARQADCGTGIQRLYAEEIIHPVRESRIKEAIWLGDLDTALARAEAHRDIRPLDMRGWLYCGEVHLKRHDTKEALAAFREAARVSPPGGGMTHFMLASCYEELGQPELALDHYLASLRIDHLAVSSAEGALRLAQLQGSPTLAWVRHHLHKLTELRDQLPPVEDAAYRHLPPPEPKPDR